MTSAAVCLLIAFASLATACTSLTGGDCVSLGVFAVSVTVRDARTGQPPADATLVLADGRYEETGLAFRRDGRLTLSGGSERPGTYVVTVRSPGYVDWVRRDVRVARGGRCDYVQPAQLTAELVRAPDASGGD